MKKPELIVMLTKNDYTIENAYDIFVSCKDTKAQYWGIKDKGIPLQEMKKVFDAFRQHGKTTVLEVVAYTEEEGLKGAQLALECGCDILMGTLFYDSINDFCKSNNLKYMPFVGDVSGRPSVLKGTVSEILHQADDYLAKGVYGVDLLGYRYEGDARQLNEALISKTSMPVCLAGSINSYERLDEVARLSPEFFTIGSAFLDRIFGDEFSEQIYNVYTYMKNK